MEEMGLSGKLGLGKKPQHDFVHKVAKGNICFGGVLEVFFINGGVGVYGVSDMRPGLPRFG